MNDLLPPTHNNLEQQHLSSSLSCDYRCITSELSVTSCNKPENIESTTRAFSPTQLSPPVVTLDSSITYGTDWSDGAHFDSHCWFPYSSSNSASLSVVQCATCALTLRTTDLPCSSRTSTNVDQKIPPCRPSFFNNSMPEDISMHDRHYWSYVPKLKARCAYCNQTSSPRTSHGNDNRISSIHAIESEKTDSLTTYLALGNAGQNISSPLSNLVCLWCSRNYHRKCWDRMAAEDVKTNKCDYGTLGNMIVRPQWLRRVTGSTVGFRAELTDCIDTNNALCTPVIFFINKLSGGQKGEELYRKFVRLFNPRQVFLLENDATIRQALNIYSSLPTIRICICGGDGTAGWILSHLIDIFPSLEKLPVSIYPLGTGNDLSRVLGWGYQYNPKQLLRTLTQIPHAQPMALEGWQVKFETTPAESNHENPVVRRGCCCFLYHPQFVRNTNQLKYENYLKPRNTYFFIHMSFGLDAAIALDFHARRTHDPSKFTSPFKNKFIYLNESRKHFREFFLSGAWDLGLYMRLICDGQDMTDSIRSCHTLLLLNISGYASGTNPWGRTSTNRKKASSTAQTNDNSLDQNSPKSNITTDAARNAHQFKRQDYADQTIEVLGLNTTQMSLIHMGCRGQRIAQCSQVRLELTHPIAAQMDGEPFYLVEPIAVNVMHADQVFVLRNDNQ